jgi:hypothetical protein
MEVLAGKVINYYRAIGVASIKLNDFLKVGSLIRIKGHTTDFEQVVESLQIKHSNVAGASAGDVAGLKVNDFVRKYDCVYRVES